MKIPLVKEKIVKKFLWEIYERVGVFRTSPLLSCNQQIPPYL